MNWTSSKNSVYQEGKQTQMLLKYGKQQSYAVGMKQASWKGTLQRTKKQIIVDQSYCYWFLSFVEVKLACFKMSIFKGYNLMF